MMSDGASAAHIYPASLIPRLRSAWRRRRWKSETVPSLPPRATLLAILDIAYHATFTIEEGRRTKFRLLVASPSEVESRAVHTATPPHTSVQFAERRPFSVHEITRLAPATDPTRVLLGVSASESDGMLGIWGLVDAGSSWYEFVHHESGGGMPPPNLLTISANEPGNLEISRGGHALVSLRRGTVAEPQSALYSGPLATFISSAQEGLYRQVIENLGVSHWSDQDDDYPARAYVFVLEQIFTRISAMGHGGAIILIRDELELSDTRLRDRMTVKYPTGDRRLWDLLSDSLVLQHQFYEQHLPLYDASTLTGEQWRRDRTLDERLEETEKALRDAIRFVAALSGVDGSIVLSDRLRVLGFGAEVTTLSPSLKSVALAESPAGTSQPTTAIEAFGTRHRAAFRFASSFDDAIVFVLSQDGGVKAVKRVGPDVVLWPDLATTPFG